MSISDTLMRRSKEIVAEKKALLKKGDSSIQLAIGEGKDIMSILCASYSLQLAPGHCADGSSTPVLVKENMSADEEDRLPDEELLAQMS